FKFKISNLLPAKIVLITCLPSTSKIEIFFGLFIFEVISTYPFVAGFGYTLKVSEFVSPIPKRQAFESRKVGKSTQKLPAPSLWMDSVSELPFKSSSY